MIDLNYDTASLVRLKSSIDITSAVSGASSKAFSKKGSAKVP
jgi:hypothetical protein